MGIRAFSDAGMLVRESVDVQRLTCGIQKQGETSAEKALRDMQAQYGCRMMFMEEADGDYIEISRYRQTKPLLCSRFAAILALMRSMFWHLETMKTIWICLGMRACPLPWAMRIGRYSKWLPW